MQIEYFCNPATSFAIPTIMGAVQFFFNNICQGGLLPCIPVRYVKVKGQTLCEYMNIFHLKTTLLTNLRTISIFTTFWTAMLRFAQLNMNEHILCQIVT